MTPSWQLQAESLGALLKESRRVLALTGAGISTEAGIPDFRSPESGLWHDRDLMELLSARGFRRDPKRFYERSLAMMPQVLTARPTSAHRLLTRLERAGKLSGIVTQNIDGLHQRAGSSNVLEIHGTYRTGHCAGCAAGLDLVEKLRKDPSLPPRCEFCGEVIKPDIVLFGDLIPLDVYAAASGLLDQSDLLLVFGSSLSVAPVTELPDRALARNIKLAIVNLEPTDYDRAAALVIRAKLGEIIPILNSALGFAKALEGLGRRD